MSTEDSLATESRNEGGARRKIRVPTALVVTLVGGALTILILPAFTRQWEERQRALDLKTALVDEISTATGRSITSAEILFETFDGKPATFELRTSRVAPGLGLRRSWLSDRLKIEGKLRAYFPPKIFHRWRAYDTAMVNFLYLTGVEGRMNEVRRQAERDGRAEPVGEAIGGFDALAVRGYLESIPVPDKRRQDIQSMLLGDQLWERRFGFLALERVLLDIEAAFTSRLLAAEPNGFSTSRRDLIDDLLP